MFESVELSSAAELEAHLRGAGFFGGGARDIVADLFLGYRLGDALRRRTELPPPPEPCPLPSIACRIRPEREPARPAGAFRVGAWRASWDESAYASAVDSVRAAIARGDVYQVNLVQHLAAPFEGDPAGIAEALRPLRPLHPRALEGPGWTIVSASPELFLERRRRLVRTAPIKGTRPAGSRGLAGSEKDVAEHVMIVDLERNDLGRVCVPGTVRWATRLAERQLAGVTHLVSTVEGELRRGVGLAELLGATFPGGSVTGAPKVAALDLIAALEPVGRGASMGALGTIRPDGDLELALTIRTFAVAGEEIHLWVGGAVVWDSDPAGEVAESWVKARPLLDALAAAGGAALTPT